MSFRKWFYRNTQLSQITFIVILAYVISSFMVLLLALGILPYLPAGFYLDYRELLTFALISMALVVLVSVYHLSTMIDRKKRKTDMSAAN